MKSNIKSASKMVWAYSDRRYSYIADGVIENKTCVNLSGSLHIYVVTTLFTMLWQLFWELTDFCCGNVFCNYICSAEPFPSGDVYLGGSHYHVLKGNHGVCRVWGRADVWSTCSGSSTEVLSRGRRGMWFWEYNEIKSS